jgi:ACT domain-containing protein
MGLSEFEIGKIAEIVAGRVGTRLDAKALRHVVDRVADAMKEQEANPGITGVTCDVSGTTVASRRENPAESSVPAQTVLPPDEALVSEKGGLYEQIERTDGTRIIVAAFGKDRPGIVAALTNVLAEQTCSIEDISQTLMQEFFSMIMVVRIDNCPIDFSALRDKLQATEAQFGMKVYVMHEDIFRYMHRI